MKLQKLGGIAAIASVCMTIAYYMSFSLIQEKLGDMSDPVKVITAVATAPFDFYVLNLMAILANLLGMIFICVLYKQHSFFFFVSQRQVHISSRLIY